MTALERLGELARCADDPHEFATAYVQHVEKTGQRPDPAVAVWRWNKYGRVSQ